MDYVRQAQKFGTRNVDSFFYEQASELSDLVDFLPGSDGESEKTEQVWNLCRRHGNQVAYAMKRMREVHEDLYTPIEENSLLGMISGREYLKDPVERLVETLCELLLPAVGKMFSNQKPKDEADLNDKTSALLDSHHIDLEREHPSVSFAGGHAIPDHGSIDIGVLIEGKYIRKGTPPSKASEGMAADLTKYPQDIHILFVVYDPERAIKDDHRFKNDFERRGRCTVLLIR